jgi:hypothetical protein
MANEVIEFDPFDPKKIYSALIKRCKAAKRYEIRCIIDESWVGVAPFDLIIEDGIFICFPVAMSRRDAFLQVANGLPVIKFLTRQNE